MEIGLKKNKNFFIIKKLFITTIYHNHFTMLITRHSDVVGIYTSKELLIIITLKNLTGTKIWKIKVG